MRDFVNEDELLRDFVAPVVPQQDLPAPVDPVLEVLVKAHKRLRDPANWQKREGMLGGPTCALGACYDASRRISGRTMLGSKAVDALQAFVPQGFVHLPHYNDDPATTHADVLALFDRAIASRKVAANA